MLKQEYGESVVEEIRMSERIMSLKLGIKGVMLNSVSAYAPQVGCQKRERNSGVCWMKW